MHTAQKQILTSPPSQGTPLAGFFYPLLLLPSSHTHHTTFLDIVVRCQRRPLQQPHFLLTIAITITPHTIIRLIQTYRAAAPLIDLSLVALLLLLLLQTLFSPLQPRRLRRQLFLIAITLLPPLLLHILPILHILPVNLPNIPQME